MISGKTIIASMENVLNAQPFSSLETIFSQICLSVFERTENRELSTGNRVNWFTGYFEGFSEC